MGTGTRVGSGAVFLVVVFVLAPCDDPVVPMGCQFGESTRSIAGTFMTWNLYLGASVHQLIVAENDLLLPMGNAILH